MTLIARTVHIACPPPPPTMPNWPAHGHLSINDSIIMLVKLTTKNAYMSPSPPPVHGHLSINDSITMLVKLTTKNAYMSPSPPPPTCMWPPCIWWIRPQGQSTVPPPPPTHTHTRKHWPVYSHLCIQDSVTWLVKPTAKTAHAGPILPSLPSPLPLTCTQPHLRPYPRHWAGKTDCVDCPHSSPPPTHTHKYPDTDLYTATSQWPG